MLNNQVSGFQDFPPISPYYFENLLHCDHHCIYILSTLLGCDLVWLDRLKYKSNVYSDTENIYRCVTWLVNGEDHFSYVLNDFQTRSI